MKMEEAAPAKYQCASSSRPVNYLYGVGVAAHAFFLRPRRGSCKTLRTALTIYCTVSVKLVEFCTAVVTSFAITATVWLWGAGVGCGLTPPPEHPLTLKESITVSAPSVDLASTATPHEYDGCVATYGLAVGDVKESRDDNPTRDLQMATDRT